MIRKEAINRRDFLKWVMVWIGTISTPPLAQAVMKALVENKVRSREEILGELETEHRLTQVNEALANYLTEHPEYLEQIRETMEHRKKIGFVALPNEFRHYNPELAISGWEKAKSFKFENKMVGEMKKYGEVMQKICQTVFGVKYPRLVRGVESEGVSGGTCFFTGRDQRIVGWPPLGNYPTKDTFLIGLHEVVGHASDPELCDYFPPQVFFEMVAGKWEMLSAAFEVRGQFFNSPGDEVIPMLEMDLAESVGKHWLIDRDIVDLEGCDLLLSELSKMSSGSQNIIFTKQFCASFGERLFGMTREGTKTYLSEVYEEKLGQMMEEIYAEMVKWRLLTEDYFDKDEQEGKAGTREVAKNTVITRGLGRVLFAIYGREIALDDVKTNLDSYRQSLPPKLVDLEPIFEEVDSGLAEAPVVNEGLRRVAEVQRLTREYLTTGKLPICSDEIVRAYFDRHWQITRKYPRASEIHGNPQVSIEAFDPPYLHIWESRAVSEAMSQGMVAEMIGEMVKGGDMERFRDYVARALPVMESLISRGEFIKAPNEL